MTKLRRRRGRRHDFGGLQVGVELVLGHSNRAAFQTDTVAVKETLLDQGVHGRARDLQPLGNFSDGEHDGLKRKRPSMANLLPSIIITSWGRRKSDRLPEWHRPASSRASRPGRISR